MCATHFQNRIFQENPKESKYQYLQYLPQFPIIVSFYPDKLPQDPETPLNHRHHFLQGCDTQRSIL